MPYQYLEPTQPPRGAEITTLEARKRIIANARLANYQDPQPFNGKVQHRQLVKQVRRIPLEPYTTPVSEGLTALVAEQEKRTNGGG